MLASLVGQSFGPYRFDALLGEGGFATVYRGYQTSLGRPVALKVLDPRLARIPQFIERFRREAEATFSLRHANIVEVYDFRQFDGNWVIVMEYVDGPTLRQLLKDKGAYDVRGGEDEVTRLHDEAFDDRTILRELTRAYQALDCGLVAEVGREVCAALAHAHNLNVIHRDLKPDNVLLSTAGVAKLGDFGIASVQEETRLTRTGLRIGSVAYMSPEQILGRRVDARSDIYSLGVTLYELLTGTVPFVGSDTAVWQMHLREVPERPTALRQDVPQALEQVVLRCLEKDPGARYQTAEEVGRALAGAVKPTPLITLFGSQAKTTGNSLQVPTGAAGRVCPTCGSNVDGDATTVPCPGCGETVTREEADAERQGWLRCAQNFVAGFGLPSDLSLDVRAYEYERSIGPALQQRINSAIETWQKALANGSVISPASEVSDRPAAPQVVAAAKTLHETASLLESEPVANFVITLAAKTARREQATALRAQARIALGLYHSILGANGTDTKAMTSAYQCAQRCFAWARTQLEQDNEIGRWAGLAERLADVVLRYPQSPPQEDEMEGLAQALAPLAATFPGAAADLATVKDYLAPPEQQRIAAAHRQAEEGLRTAQQALAARDEQLRLLEAEEEQAVQNHSRRRNEVEETQRIRKKQLVAAQQRLLALAVASPVLFIILWLVLFGYLLEDSSRVGPYSLLAVSLSSVSGFYYGRSGLRFDWERSCGIGCLTILSGTVGLIAALAGLFGNDLAGTLAVLSVPFVELYVGDRVRLKTEELRTNEVNTQRLLSEIDAEAQGELSLLAGRRAHTENAAHAAAALALQACEQALAVIQHEAARWSARLLRQRSPADLVDTSDLQEGLRRWQARVPSQAQAKALGTSRPPAGQQAASLPAPSGAGEPGKARPVEPKIKPASAGSTPETLPTEKTRHSQAPQEVGRVELSGGWNIPIQGLLGFSADCQLDARVTITGQGLQWDKVISATADYFRACGYSPQERGSAPHRTPGGTLELRRGSLMGKWLGSRIKGFPTQITVTVQEADGGAIEVHLGGSVSAEGAVATDTESLRTELKGYVEALDKWRRAQ